MTKTLLPSHSNLIINMLTDLKSNLI